MEAFWDPPSNSGGEITAYLARIRYTRSSGHRTYKYNRNIDPAVRQWKPDPFPSERPVYFQVVLSMVFTWYANWVHPSEHVLFTYYSFSSQIHFSYMRLSSPPALSCTETHLGGVVSILVFQWQPKALLTSTNLGSSYTCCTLCIYVDWKARTAMKMS